MKAVMKLLFFGNYFIGFCVAAMALETSYLLNLPHNDFLFYLLTFIATVFYYSIAYINEKPLLTSNKRADWYLKHHRSIVLIQKFLVGLMLVGSFLFFEKNSNSFLHQPLLFYVLLALFPIVALMYYGIHPRAFRIFKLRNVGWLKPFLIGFTWSGMVTVFPVIFYSCTRQKPLPVSLNWLLLFIINFLFVSILAILFDIKDYTSDFNLQLKTFIVKKGLKKTLYFVLFPLWALCTVLVCCFIFTQNRSIYSSLLLLLPFLVLLPIPFSIQKQRGIFYYLVFIDGLMLFKAVCGICAALLS